MTDTPTPFLFYPVRLTHSTDFRYFSGVLTTVRTMLKYLHLFLFATWMMVDLTAAGQNVSIGGVINEYSPVTAIGEGCGNEVFVEDPSAFSVGDRVLIIQMKGAEINLSNTSSFGEVTNINSAGLYEFGTIAGIIGNQIILENLLLNEYEVDGLVQLVFVPQYENATVTTTLTADGWNGETWGIIALEVEGTLTLEAPITAQVGGFQLGFDSEDFFQPGLCASQDYFFTDNPALGAEKGEGITILPPGFETGRGPAANGGGGGNNLNSGGGGGGHIGAGGRGGNEWSGCIGESVGGLGGRALDFPGRIFFGGGGGGGHQNNGEGSNGSDGGGIIIIRANSLVSNGFTITSRGDSNPLIAGIDGAGGGGAGGTIILDVVNFVDEVNVSVEGGEGASLSNGFTGGATGAQCHGPGGGGGGGLIGFTADAIPPTAVLSVAGGAPGLNINPQSACFGESYGAEPGEDGLVVTGFEIVESDLVPIVDVEASGDADICLGTCTPINVSGAVEFSWSPEEGLSDPNAESPTACPEESTTYLVTGTDANECTFIDSVTVSVVESFTVDIDLAICEGDSVFLEGGFQSSSGSYVDTLVTEAGCDSVITTNLSLVDASESTEDLFICEGDSIFLGGEFRSVAGTYVDTLETVIGCDSVVTTELEITPLPEITAEDAFILPCEPVQLLALGGQTYTWQPDSALSCTDCPNPLASPSTTTVYVVTGTVAGCSNTDTVTVTVDDFDVLASIRIPNIFTPNGDGRNDNFRIEWGECLELAETKVFNRWGQVVFETSGAVEFWDGAAPSEEEVPDGQYFYLITFRILDNAGNSESVLSGVVTVLR